MKEEIIESYYFISELGKFKLVANYSHNSAGILEALEQCLMHTLSKALSRAEAKGRPMMRSI